MSAFPSMVLVSITSLSFFKDSPLQSFLVCMFGGIEKSKMFVKVLECMQ